MNQFQMDTSRAACYPPNDTCIPPIPCHSNNLWHHQETTGNPDHVGTNDLPKMHCSCLGSQSLFPDVPWRSMLREDFPMTHWCPSQWSQGRWVSPIPLSSSPTQRHLFHTMTTDTEGHYLSYCIETLGQFLRLLTQGYFVLSDKAVFFPSTEVGELFTPIEQHWGTETSTHPIPYVRVLFPCSHWPQPGPQTA